MNESRINQVRIQPRSSTFQLPIVSGFGSEAEMGAEARGAGTAENEIGPFDFKKRVGADVGTG